MENHNVQYDNKTEENVGFSISVQSMEESPQKWVTDNYKDYNLLGVIGVGAFAKVWFAQFNDPRKKVASQNFAVKIIELESTNPLTIEETQKETALMGSLNHENVVACLASFVVGSELWLVMPLLIGGSFAAIMRRHPEFKNGFKDENILATVLKDVLNGLVYFHKDSRIHRDIKAGNILLSEDGVSKLSDFGVSAALIESGYKRTGRRTFTGTPCWMAPEVMESQGHNHKADIWSLGITALELAFGKPPYADQRPMKIMIMVTQNDPPSAHAYSTEERKKDSLGRDFHKFVKMMLKKNPTKRPKAKDLLKENYLKKAKGHEYVKNRVLCSLPPAKIKPEKWEISKTQLMSVPNTDRTRVSGISWNFSDKPVSKSFRSFRMNIIDEELSNKPNEDQQKNARYHEVKTDS